MTKFVVTLVAAMFFMATPAMAGVEGLVRGVNSVVTAPFDVAHGMLEPERVVDAANLHSKLGMANMVTDRVGGVGVGLWTAAKRMTLGLVDIATFPFTDMVNGPYSLDARYGIVASNAVEAGLCEDSE